MKILDPNDPEQAVEIERRWSRWYDWTHSTGPLLLAVFFFAFVIGATLVGNQLWYGDWRCAYLNCVRATEIKFRDAGRKE